MANLASTAHAPVASILRANGVPIYIPNEVLRMFVGYLGSEDPNRSSSGDLIAMRLACHATSEYATPLLFDRINISLVSPKAYVNASGMMRKYRDYIKKIYIFPLTFDVIDRAEFRRRVRVNFGNGRNPEWEGHAIQGWRNYQDEKIAADDLLRGRHLGFLLSYAANNLPNVRQVVLKSAYKPAIPDDRLQRVSCSLRVLAVINVCLSC